jgi:hypothetical protein
MGLNNPSVIGLSGCVKTGWQRLPRPEKEPGVCPRTVLDFPRVVGQFDVAALYERRNSLNQNPAVIDRRYKETKVPNYPLRGFPAQQNETQPLSLCPSSSGGSAQ